MRILIMVHNLTGGGAERVAALWATGFVSRGYEVGIVLNCKKNTPITYTVPPEVKMYNVRGCRFMGWVANKLYCKLHNDTYYKRKLKTILQEFQPDVAIGVIQPWAEWVRKASKGMEIKIINTEHNSFERPHNALYNPMTKKLYRQKYIINKRYNHVTVLTREDEACVKGILNNVSVLPNPLAFTPAESVPKKDKIILASGRLDAWHCKGFDILIKAWGKVAKQYPEWKLQIAGKGKSQASQYLQSLADEEHIGRQLEFIGYQCNMLPIYQCSSIFVLSSRYEGFGMVLIEAMSQGCACIACDYKGRQCEIITSDDEGVICPVDDVEALSLAMGRMIDDEEFRRKVQRKAIIRSKYYSLGNTMDRWEELLKKISS